MTASEPLKVSPAAGPRGALARNWRDIVIVGVLAAAAAKVAYDRSGDKEALTNPSGQLAATVAPAPKLEVSGTASAGGTLWYTCWNLQPGESPMVVIGPAASYGHIGGHTVVPQPTLVFRRQASHYAIDGSGFGKGHPYGTLHVVLRMPKVMPQGMNSIWAQVWSDAGGSWRGSNAVQSIVPKWTASSPKIK